MLDLSLMTAAVSDSRSLHQAQHYDISLAVASAKAQQHINLLVVSAVERLEAGARCSEGC